MRAMKILHILRAAAIALALAFPAYAAQLLPDPTGIWFDPAAPGWGLSIAQQGPTSFAVLFVYDDQHNPVWFVAPRVTDAGRSLDTGGEIFSSPLYRTTGQPFSGPFDPSQLTVDSVGTLQLAYTPEGAISIAYN